MGGGAGVCVQEWTRHSTVLQNMSAVKVKDFLLAWILQFVVQQIIPCLKKIHNVLKHSARYVDLNVFFQFFK